MRYVALLISLALLPLCSQADELTSIQSICKSELSGNERMIKICIRQESEAYLALQTYHASLKPILEDCKKRVGRHGWNMQKMCVDKQIVAEKIIATTP